jgi:5-methylthioadenosine/S-adenosylhomocysteine deaminase
VDNETTTRDTRLLTRVDAAFVIGFDGVEHRLICDGSLMYEGETITYVGPRVEAPADRVLDARDRIVSPGFICMHSHLCDSPFAKSFRDDIGNKQFWMSGLYEHLGAIAGASTDEIARAAIRYSLHEVVGSGVTTVVDLTYALPDETAELAEALGLRAYVAPFFRSAFYRVDEGKRVGFDWLSETEEDAAFEHAVEFARRHAHGDLVRSLLAPAQVDTCRPELLSRTREAAEALAVPIQIHAAQTVLEFHELLRRHGRTPVQFLADVGLLGPDLTIAHCIFTAGHSWLAYPPDDDLALLAKSGTKVAHCPWVFGRYGIALESFARYEAAGITLSLGTDTSPQSMLLELRAAATFGKFADRNPLAVRAKDVFDAATLGGAAALGRDDLGRLAPGAKADFVCFQTDTINMAPLRDPVKNIVYSALPSDVDRVVVHGRDIIVDGRIEGADEQRLAADVQRAAEDLWSGFPRHDWAGRTVDEMSPPSLALWDAARAPAPQYA